MEAIPEPRQALSAKAPRVVTKQIPVDKIGEVIGPKGKRINEIIATTGADIDIQDDGTVFIGSKEGDGAERAVKMIDEILNPRIPEIGERFRGKVVKTTTFGAFVSLMPGTDGLLHISKLGRGKRVESVEDVVNTGDEIEVIVSRVEEGGRRISVDPIWEGEEPPSVEELKAKAAEKPEGRSRGGGGRRPPRDGDRDRGGRGPRRPSDRG
jgi:polyribonucleotide nucleotidyltransferase